MIKFKLSWLSCGLQEFWATFPVHSSRPDIYTEGLIPIRTETSYMGELLQNAKGKVVGRLDRSSCGQLRCSYYVKMAVLVKLICSCSSQLQLRVLPNPVRKTVCRKAEWFWRFRRWVFKFHISALVGTVEVLRSSEKFLSFLEVLSSLFLSSLSWLLLIWRFWRRDLSEFDSWQDLRGPPSSLPGASLTDHRSSNFLYQVTCLLCVSVSTCWSGSFTYKDCVHAAPCWKGNSSNVIQPATPQCWFLTGMASSLDESWLCRCFWQIMCHCAKNTRNVGGRGFSSVLLTSLVSAGLCWLPTILLRIWTFGDVSLMQPRRAPCSVVHFCQNRLFSKSNLLALAGRVAALLDGRSAPGPG